MLSQCQTLNKIITKKDFSLVSLNNLTEDYFFNYRAEFNYIKKHYDTYRNIPDAHTFLNQFPDFDLFEVNEPDNYLIEQLVKDYNQSYLAQRFNGIKKMLENDDVSGAMQYFLGSVDNLRQGTSMTCTNIMEDISRYDRYIDMEVNKCKYFISTGFKELDKIITGIDRRNENMVIAARTGVGKSWLLLAMAAAASKQGLRVGIYSGEMSVDKVAYRLDTLLGHVDNKGISRGDGLIKNQYKEYLLGLKSGKYGPIKVITPNDIAGPATVDALQMFIEKEQLEILFIDQYSLLEDTSKSKIMHERVANISKAVKNLQVMKQIPIISVAQMNRTKNEDKTQDSTQIGLSDRIPQDATVLLMLDKYVEMEEINGEKVPKDKSGAFNVKINIVKSRDGGDNRILEYHWDFNTGHYTYIPHDGDGIFDGDSSAALANSYEEDYDFEGQYEPDDYYN